MFGHRNRMCFVALATLLMVSLSGATALAKKGDPAVVTVFHAIPAEDGFPADAYLDGELIIDGFVFETSSESFEIPPGTVTIDIYPDGADPATESPAVSTSITLKSGANYSIVAQIADGSPVILVFENDTSGVGPGEARVTFRQTSAAPELSVAIDGTPTFDNLAQTEEATTDLDAGERQVTIDDGSAAPIFDDTVDVGDGTLTILYAVGDPADGTFDVLVQEVLIPQVSPLGVATGSGGDKAASGSAGWLIPAALALSGMALVRRRREA